MTIAEFGEAMKTDAMKLEFAALLNKRNVETAEALIQAMSDFAASKGVVIPERSAKKELTDDELENAAGGFDITNDPDWLANLCQNYYGNMFGGGFEALGRK